ncbi:uncharacterized protein LOC141617208 [Silene latifolia]|uniref:uncharacterized protein LOC141617208 n=1 Tax=Silene latifolia TaxID=37657 RepID=UPI003D777336
MKEFNQALLAKIGSRMITQPDSILSKSIGAKYGLRWRDGDLLFNDGKSNSSWGWKGIVWGLQLIKPLLSWNISPLSDLSVWNTKWVNGMVPKTLCSGLLTDSPNLNILAIPVQCSEGSGNFFWSASSSGNYSVKIGYHIALKNSWNTSATPKDLSRGFLKRGFDGPFTCVLCDSQETETPDHLFRDCSFASRVWAGSVLGIRAQSGDNLNIQSWVCNWLSVLFKADNKQEACLSFLCTIWTIWVTRCRRVFDDSKCSPIGAILLYQDSLKLTLCAEDRKSGSLTFQTSLEEDLANLRNGVLFPLIQGSLNFYQSHIYVDAAWSKELIAGLGGYIMVDNEVLSEFCIKGSAENAEQAEALAIREALNWALSRNILHITIFSDCLQVLAQVLKFYQLKHWIRNTVEDITKVAANFHCVSFAYVPRICNKAAHRLAKRDTKL